MSNEPEFSLEKFFEFGVFKPEDVELLTSIAEGKSDPVPQISQYACANLISIPPDTKEVDPESWISENTMDFMLQFLASKYPDVFFVFSMDWTDQHSQVYKRFKRKTVELISKRYLVSCVCVQGHWYWVTIDFESKPPVLYYGDNHNSDSPTFNKLLLGMLFFIYKITSGAKGCVPDLKMVPCPEFLDDINNCGAYSICYLLAMMESKFDPVRLEQFFAKGLITKEKMPFVRYRLAMCVVLGQLNVPIDYTEALVPDANPIPLDTSLIPMFQFLNSIELVTDPVEPHEWQPPVVFSDLTTPHPLAETYIHILYMIGTHSGISQIDLLRQCEEKSIEEESLFQYLNITCRHGEKSRKLQKSQRIVREYCGAYYLTAAVLPLFQQWNWSFSRYDKITLKKKITRRTPKVKPLLLLEDGPKKPRTYRKSGMKIPWKKIVCELIEPYKIPMTTGMIKKCFSRTYTNANILELPQQSFTLRILQGIDELMKDKKKASAKKTSPTYLIRLPGNLAEVIPYRNLTHIVTKMSADMRAAALDYVRYSPRDNFDAIDGIVTLRDQSNFTGILERVQQYHDSNMANSNSYVFDLENAFAESYAYRWRFIEFLTRLAIEKNIESLNHFRMLIFLKEAIAIHVVTLEHMVASWDKKSIPRRSKTNACTKFVAKLENVLYINQCEKNATPSIEWVGIDGADDVQQRLVCKVKSQPDVIGVDSEGYLCATKNIYYGTLFEVPEKRDHYEQWFMRLNYHNDTESKVYHGFLVELNGVPYLECRYNLLPGERFFHVL